MNELEEMLSLPKISDEATLKKCTFCAEKIQPEAIKCRYCGEFLTPSRPYSPGSSSSTGNKWYHSTGSVIGALACLGPMALPLVWTHPHYKLSTKIIMTVAVAVITILALYLTVEATLIPLRQLKELGM